MQILSLEQGELHVSGEIHFDNADAYYQQGLALIRQQSLPLVINLSQLERPSTLSLAVFVAWIRELPQVNDLVFKAVPEKMIKILQATDLKDTLSYQH